MAKAVAASIKTAIDDPAKTNKANMKLTTGAASSSDVNKAVRLFNQNAEKAKTLLSKAKPFSAKK
eukprot:7561476-Pyramimonas_sp.AAC.2